MNTCMCWLTTAWARSPRRTPIADDRALDDINKQRGGISRNGLKRKKKKVMRKTTKPFLTSGKKPAILSDLTFPPVLKQVQFPC